MPGKLGDRVYKPFHTRSDEDHADAETSRSNRN